MKWLKVAATVAVALSIAVLMGPSAGATSSAGTPTASTADSCLAAMKTAKTAPDGSAATPSACTAAVAAAAGALIDRCAFGGLLLAEAGTGMVLIEADGKITRVRRFGANGIAVLGAALAIGLAPSDALRRAASE